MNERNTMPKNPVTPGELSQQRQKDIRLAEQRLGRLEMQLRSSSVNRRMGTRQRMLERSIQQQRWEIKQLKAAARRDLETTTRATRYVGAGTKPPKKPTP